MLHAILHPVLRNALRPVASLLVGFQAFSTFPRLWKGTNLPPRPKPPPDSEIEEKFIHGSGPGGQKINKTASQVQLKHIPTGITLKCQATRSRSQNRKIARELLAKKIDDYFRGDESRSSVVGEFKRKKRASSAKKSRRKYRKLEEEKAAGETSKDGFEDDIDDGGEEVTESREESSRPTSRQTDERIVYERTG